MIGFQWTLFVAAITTACIACSPSPTDPVIFQSPTELSARDAALAYCQHTRGGLPLVLSRGKMDDYLSRDDRDLLQQVATQYQNRRKKSVYQLQQTEETFLADTTMCRITRVHYVAPATLNEGARILFELEQSDWVIPPDWALRKPKQKLSLRRRLEQAVTKRHRRTTAVEVVAMDGRWQLVTTFRAKYAKALDASPADR